MTVIAPPVFLIVKTEFPPPSQLPVRVMFCAFAAAAAIDPLLVAVTDGVTVKVLVAVAALAAMFVAVAVLVAVFSGFNTASVVAVMVGVAVSIIVSIGVLVRVSVATEVSTGSCSTGGSVAAGGSVAIGGSVAAGGSVAMGGSVASMPPVPNKVFCGIQDVKIDNKTKITVRELIKCREFFRGI